ncbi:MAG: MotA/TolQ/ExbB proton channel family protein [Myxococcota bacterium]
MTGEAASSTFNIDPIAFWTILAASMVLFALALEQLYTYWRLVDTARALGTETQKALYKGDLVAARTLCERSTSPVADVLLAAMNKVGHSGESLHKAAERERQRLGLWMRRRLWALGTIGAVAPFVGLFGTVVGIIRAFRDIASAGAMGFPVVAKGVSEALIATAGGIFVAVLAVILYNYFQARANQSTVEIRLVVDEFLEQLQVQADRGGAR